MKYLKGIFFNSTALFKISLVLFITVSTYSITNIFLFFIFKTFFKLDLLSIYYTINNQNNIFLTKIYQIFQTISLFFLPSIIVGYLVYYSITDFFRINFKIKLSSLFISILIFLLLIPFTDFLAVLNEKIKFPPFLYELEMWMKTQEKNANKIAISLLSYNSFLEIILNIFVVSLFPAICEEFFFRGLLQRIFTQFFHNIHLSIIFISIIFSTIHLQFFSFLPRFLLGLILGYFFEIHKSIVIPIIIHFLNNFLGLLFFYAYNKTFINTFNILNNKNFYISYILLLIFTSIAIYLFITIYKKEIHYKKTNLINSFV